MADLHPSNPRQLLEDAANATSGLSSVKPETFPTEVRSEDLDAWLLDPREEEQDHTSEGAGQRLYNRVPIEYIIYIVTEGGEGQRKAARDTLTTLRDRYLTALFDKFESNGTAGTVEKTGRLRSQVRNGESELMVEAVSLQVSQHQDY